MRNRILEIVAALAGIAIVVMIYLDRNQPATAPELAPARAPVPLPMVAEPAAEPTPASTPVTATPDAGPAIEPPPASESPEIAEALVSLESAREEVEAVETALGVLDQRFDAKEAELAEREAQGLDPESLEEEMLIFLDGIVEEYDELETRLAEAEAAELAAAERLSRLGGRAAVDTAREN